MAIARPSQTFRPSIDAACAHTGMRVLAHNHEALGVVREVWAYVRPYGYVAKSTFAIADYGPIRGTLHLLDSADGYIQVAPCSGIAREGERDLYIPFSSIRDLVADQALIVDHLEADCDASFGECPAWLEAQR